MERRVRHDRGERSARNAGRLVLDWGGTKRPLLPGSQVPGYTTGATASLGSDQPIARAAVFHSARCQRQRRNFLRAVGVQNEAELKSNWPDPGFRGAFLPAERSVRPDGFNAKWKVSYYGRDYPQKWTSRSGNERFNERRFRPHFSARSSCRSSTPIATSSARSSTACSFSSSFSRLSSSSK